MTQREEMEKVIWSGGGVLYSGRVITRLEHLPSDEELAANDATKRAGRIEQIDAEIARLQAEKDQLLLAHRPADLPAAGAVADAPVGSRKSGVGSRNEKQALLPNSESRIPNSGSE